MGAHMLRKAASNVVGGSDQLNLMATRVQLDAFVEVKKMITNLVAELKQKKSDETKKRDYCINSLDENDKASFDATTKGEELQSKKVELENTIEKLSKQLEAVQSSIEQL